MSINTEEYWTLLIGLVSFGCVCGVSYFGVSMPAVPGWNRAPAAGLVASNIIGYAVLIVYTIAASILAQFSMGRLSVANVVDEESASSTTTRVGIVAYLVLILITVASSIVGANIQLHNWGLGVSIWCILGGMLVRNCFRVDEHFATVPKMEFYIKISIVLLAIDLHQVKYVGLYGLVVAFAETIVTMLIIYGLARALKFDFKNAIVMAGASQYVDLPPL
jgi:hypothetical protein